MGAEADFGGFAGDAVEAIDFGGEFGFVPADDGAIRGEEKDAGDADFGGHADGFLQLFGLGEAEGEGDSLGGFGVWVVSFDGEGGFAVEGADEGATVAGEEGRMGLPAGRRRTLWNFFASSAGRSMGSTAGLGMPGTKARGSALSGGKGLQFHSPSVRWSWRVNPWRSAAARTSGQFPWLMPLTIQYPPGLTRWAATGLSSMRAALMMLLRTTS